MVSVRATRAERERHLPGDAAIAEPVAVVMHAITIGATPLRVWPWLVQMGSGRAGWYSYDRVDNDGHPSEDLGRVGADWPGDKGRERRPKDSSSRPIEVVYAVLAKVPRWVMGPTARLGHHVMQARQLRGIKRRAEDSTHVPWGSGPAPRGRLAWSAIVLEVFLGVGALGGGAALMLGPRGEVLPLPVSALAGSPFTSYLVPGAILFFVIGLGPLVAAELTLRRHRWAPFLATAVGLALLTWMAVEIAIVGYTNRPPLQAIYLTLGAALVLVGVRWQRARGASA